MLKMVEQKKRRSLRTLILLGLRSIFWSALCLQKLILVDRHLPASSACWFSSGSLHLSRHQKMRKWSESLQDIFPFFPLLQCISGSSCIPTAHTSHSCPQFPISDDTFPSLVLPDQKGIRFSLWLVSGCLPIPSVSPNSYSKWYVYLHLNHPGGFLYLTGPLWYPNDA